MGRRGSPEPQHQSQWRSGLPLLEEFRSSVQVEHVIIGRLLLIKARFEQFNVVFINVYAPTNGTERKLFLEKIADELNRCNSEDYLFLGGDFNCTENAALDRNHAEPHPASQHVLRQLVFSHGLVDVWRRMNADCRQYTWSHLREGRISLARLDRVYVFKHNFNIFRMCKMIPTGFSDHSLLICHVLIRDFKPKKVHIGILTLF